VSVCVCVCVCVHVCVCEEKGMEIHHPSLLALFTPTTELVNSQLKETLLRVPDT